MAVTVWEEPPPRFEFVDVKCASCRSYPCICRRTGMCMCTGLIVVGNDLGVSMRIHQASTKHVAWRRELGL
jgi:hypothetical protein